MEANLTSYILFPNIEQAEFAKIMISADASAPLFESDVKNEKLVELFRILEEIPIADDTSLTSGSSAPARLIANWNFEYSEMEEVFTCLAKLVPCMSYHHISLDEGYEGVASIIHGKYIVYESWCGKAVGEWEPFALLDDIENRKGEPKQG